MPADKGRCSAEETHLSPSRQWAVPLVEPRRGSTNRLRAQLIPDDPAEHRRPPRATLTAMCSENVPNDLAHKWGEGLLRNRFPEHVQPNRPCRSTHGQKV